MVDQSQVGTQKAAIVRMSDLLVVVPLMSICCALLAFYYASTPLRLIAVGLQFLTYSYMMLCSTNRSLKVLSIAAFVLAVPFAVFNGLATEYKSLIVPFCLLSSIGCAWYALEFRKTWYVFELPFYFYLLLTLYLIMVQGFGPVEFNEVFTGISRNGYSAILMATACGYLISKVVRRTEPSVVLMGVTFACSIPLYGRASIVALAILFASVALRRWTIGASLLMIFALVVLALGYVELESLVNLNTNFKAGLQSDRWAMIVDYVSKLNPISIVTGVDFDELRSVQENAGSPDNAFLRLHSYIGFSMFLFLGLFIISAVELIRRRLFLLLSILIATLFRSFTDVIFLFGTIDLFFTAVLFFPFFSRYFPSSLEAGYAGVNKPAAPWGERDIAQLTIP